MALPYTQSPLGSFLATLGQGIPALADASRQRSIQDQLLQQQQQEVASKLATEGLQQKMLQSNLDYQPTERARQTFQFQSGVDPLAALMDAGNMKAAGLGGMTSVPLKLQNEVKQQAFQGNMLDSLLGATGAQGSAPAGQGAPQGAGPTSQTSMPPFSQTRMMRMAGLLNGPLTPQETAENEYASKSAGLKADQDAGKLPEADTKFVQSAMGYKNMLDDAIKGLQDPGVQHGGWARMQYEHGKYKFGLANDPAYAAIIPPLDMGKAVTLTDLASGVRNPAVRQDIGRHLADSDMSPAAMLQRAQAIQKYYPYMVYERYASRGATPPDSVAQALGMPNGAALIQYAKQIEAGITPGAAGQVQPQALNAAPAGADPLIAKYAQQFGISYAQAAQAAQQAGYGK